MWWYVTCSYSFPTFKNVGMEFRRCVKIVTDGTLNCTICLWLFQMDDEPNLYLGNGWELASPSIYNWLFRVHTVYVCFLKTPCGQKDMPHSKKTQLQPPPECLTPQAVCVFPSEKNPCVLFGPWWSFSKHNDSDDFGVKIVWSQFFHFWRPPISAKHCETQWIMTADSKKGPRSKIVWVFFETAKLGFFSGKSQCIYNIWGVYAMYYDYNSRFDLVAWKKKHAFFPQDPWDPSENDQKSGGGRLMRLVERKLH